MGDRDRRMRAELSEAEGERHILCVVPIWKLLRVVELGQEHCFVAYWRRCGAEVARYTCRRYGGMHRQWVLAQCRTACSTLLHLPPRRRRCNMAIGFDDPSDGVPKAKPWLPHRCR